MRQASSSDHEAIVELNLADEAQTSPMDLGRLAVLDRLSCYHRVACIGDQVLGFLLAIRRGAPYANDNFSWFSSRYPDFVYVDRIVISGLACGQGLGSLLYADLFRWVRQAGIPLVACEYNVVPPNEASRQFHLKFGFTEQGTQWLATRSKQVSMQVAAA